MNERLSPEQEEVNRAKDGFVNTYMMAAPYSGYINMCFITNRLMVEWEKRGRVSSIEDTRADLIAQNENPDEPFLSIGLTKELPESLPLPETFEDVKVFVKVFGEMELQQ